MDEMYYYWLHNVPGIGRLTVQKILKYITPKELYESKEMKQLDFLTEKQRENIEISKKRWEICKEWEKLQSRGIGVLGLRKSNYPVKLSTIPDPSPIIYYKGNCGILDKPSVAVIGARACSNYGSL
ncbi:MAG: DNA-processing protein DprA, partial [Lachnospiraceae bacterium]|nr:DNA-processing protein DprA [Lachnospiraceae bacterium]